jgi:DNA-binding NarL/FixJ family response regulator
MRSRHYSGSEDMTRKAPRGQLQAATARSARQWPLLGRAGFVEQITASLGSASCRAVLLVGDVGVGKSRLAAESVATAKCLAGQVTATASAASVPFAALAPLLPPIALKAEDSLGLMQRIREGLAQPSGSRRRVWIIDDADLLDSTSWALLGSLVGWGTVCIVATMRRESVVPDVLGGLWRSGQAMRIEVPSLDREATETLLHVGLGGPVSAAAVAALWRASGGNPLCLREVVAAAGADGVLVHRDGVWRVTGPLPASDGLTALIEARIAGLSAADREVLERLAVCGRLATGDALAGLAATTGQQLESLGLVSVEAEGRRHVLQLTQAMYARALRAGMSQLRAQQLLMDQVTRVRGHGGRRRDDAVALAVWELEATGTADADLLLRAAEVARTTHSSAQVRILARAALHSGPSVPASVLLASALAEEGRAAEAEEILKGLGATVDASSADEVTVVTPRAMNLFYGLGRAEEAQTLLADAIRRAGFPHPFLVASAANLAMATGEVRRALQHLDQLPPQDPSVDPIGTWYVTARAAALIQAGQLVEAEAELERIPHRPDARAVRQVMSHPAVILAARAALHTEYGRLEQAAGSADEGYQLAADNGDSVLVTWFACRRGHLALIRGALWHSLEIFAIATDTAVEQPVGQQLALAGLVVAMALGGDGRRCRELLARLDVLPPGPFPFDVGRARAWSLAAGHDDTGADRQLAETAEAALHAGHRTMAVTLLHDRLRLGARNAASALIRAGDGIPGAYIAARVGHARAVEADDVEALIRVADGFTAIDAQLYAAEVLMSAAARLRACGDPRRAAAMTSRATALLSHPELARLTLPSMPLANPLTSREKQIAGLAAQGLRSSEIAGQLVLSVRTVDNHLQRAYQKLGVTSRSELHDALHLPLSPTHPAPESAP